MLLPASVDDYVPADSPVRALDIFVDTLDLAELGFKTRNSGSRGRSGFDPATLIKIYLWGYLNRIKSSRRLEHACQSDLTLIWLTGNLRPDHSTISDFRKTHPKAIKSLLRQFNLLCRQLELFGRELLAIDGSFFKAVNSKSRSYTRAKLEKMIVRIDENIEKYLTELDALDSTEATLKTESSISQSKTASQTMEQKIASIKERREELQGYLKDCKKSPTQQKNLTDPDSVWLTKNGQSIVGYNVQSAVDAKHHLIVTIEATQDNADHGQLIPISRQAKADLGLPIDGAIELLADTGYHSGPALTTCQAENTLTLIPSRKKAGKNAGDGSIPLSDFRYDEKNDRYLCPQGQHLERKSDTHGKAGSSQSSYRNYYTVSACKDCPIRSECTKGKYRKLRISHDREAIEAAAQRLADQPEKMRQRGALVEHPFGTMKDRLGRDHFLCRGLDLVQAELSMSAFAYNFTRVVRVIGIVPLLRALTERLEQSDNSSTAVARLGVEGLQAKPA